MKTTIMALIVLSLVFMGDASGLGSQCPGINTTVSPIAASFQQLTVSTTAVGLTVPLGAKIAVISIESEPLRYRDDLTNPTAAVGVLVNVGSSLIVCSNTLERVRFIRSGGSDSTINASFYK